MERIEQLEKAGLYKGDIWTIVISQLIPQATYSLAMGLYTPRQLDTIQLTLLACLKRACGLHFSTQGTFMTLPLDMNGAGIRDLQDIYCQEAAMALRNALTNEGRLGRLTRQLYVAHWNACKNETGSTLDSMLLRSRSNKSLICRRLAMLIPRGMLPPSHTPTLVSLRAHQWIDEVPTHARAAAPGNVSTAPPPTTRRPRETAAQTANKKLKEGNTMYCPSTALYEHESYTSVMISEKRVYDGKKCPDGQVQFLCKWPTVLLEKEFAMQHLGADKPFYRYRDGGSDKRLRQTVSLQNT